MSQQLLNEAKKYSNLGYKVGIANGKALVDTYSEARVPTITWDGISIILDDLVCVDFDSNHSMDCGYGNDLPPTWKEKTPRGVHLFYLLPVSFSLTTRAPKIKWKPDIDLLVKGNRADKKPVRYGFVSNAVIAADLASNVFCEHVICSPTPGYTRVYPDNTPSINQLTIAPNWLLEAVEI